jgi:hypothetical protein
MLGFGLISVSAAVAADPNASEQTATTVKIIPANGQPGKIVAYKKVSLGQKAVAKGGILPKYGLAGLGEGETYITQYADCSYHTGGGTTRTKVYDSNYYKPEADGYFSMNGGVQDSRTNNEELFFDTASWDSRHFCAGVTANWQQHSEHTIWYSPPNSKNQSTADHEFFYVAAHF